MICKSSKKQKYPLTTPKGTLVAFTCHTLRGNGLLMVSDRPYFLHTVPMKYIAGQLVQEDSWFHRIMGHHWDGACVGFPSGNQPLVSNTHWLCKSLDHIAWLPRELSCFLHVTSFAINNTNIISTTYMEHKQIYTLLFLWTRESGLETSPQEHFILIGLASRRPPANRNLLVGLIPKPSGLFLSHIWITIRLTSPTYQLIQDKARLSGSV